MTGPGPTASPTSPQSAASSTAAAPTVPAAARPTVTAALQAVIAAQHQAYFAYPVIGVHLTDAGEITAARQAEALHRLARDDTAARLTALGATPAPAAATYAPAERVSDAASARRWALEVEQACTQAYRALLAACAAAAPQLRTPTLESLISSAEAELGWRRLVTPATPTVPFPGT